MSEQGTHVETTLITGGHGFIGRHVVYAVADSGAKPLAVVQKGGTQLEELPGSFVESDLENADEVAHAVANATKVVHLAARAGGIQFQTEGGQGVFKTNRRMTDNILEASIRAGVDRLFLASSSVIYRPLVRPIEEGDPQLGSGDGPNPYAWSKITDEVVASWYTELDTVIGRFGNVYGPGAPFDPSRSTVVHALIDRAARLQDGDDLIVWGDGSAVRSFVYVEDAARAVTSLLESGESGEAYNIDSGEPVTIAQLAEVVRDAVNPSLGLVFDESKPSGSPYRVSSTGKLQGLGFRATTSLESGIKDTVAWYRSRSPSDRAEAAE